MRVIRTLAVVFIIPASTLFSTAALSQFPYLGGSSPDAVLIPPGSFESCSLARSASERVQSCSAYINNHLYFSRDNEARQSLGFRRLGVAYMDVGENNKALATFTDAVRRFPRDANVYNDKAWAHYRLKNYDAALTDVNRALELDPRLVFAYGTRGAIHEATGKTVLAIEDYQQCLRIKSDHEFAISGLKRLGAALPSGVIDHEAVRNTPPPPFPGIEYAHQRYRSPRHRQTHGPDIGAQVASVMPGSMAARAGIRSGDVIVAAGGRRVATGSDVQLALQAARNAARRTVDVVVAGPGGQRQVTLSW